MLSKKTLLRHAIVKKYLKLTSGKETLDPDIHITRQLSILLGSFIKLIILDISVTVFCKYNYYLNVTIETSFVRETAIDTLRISNVYDLHCPLTVVSWLTLPLAQCEVLLLSMVKTSSRFITQRHRLFNDDYLMAIFNQAAYYFQRNSQGPLPHEVSSLFPTISNGETFLFAVQTLKLT